MSLNITQFVVYLLQSVRDFGSNLRYSPQSHTKEEWFQIFLNWMEWKTEMHKEYWEEEKDNG
jgi:hypothetical protein